MWEFAALLGGLVWIITISLRKFAPDSAEVMRRHRWLFVGMLLLYRASGHHVLPGVWLEHFGSSLDGRSVLFLSNLPAPFFRFSSSCCG